MQIGKPLIIFYFLIAIPTIICAQNTREEMMSKLESVDQSYPDGGLVGYLQNAVELLEKSRRGENPLEGWSPSVPQGETYEVGTEAFLSTEELGLKEVGKCGFVLVAGG